MKQLRWHYKRFAYSHLMSDLFDHAMRERMKQEALLAARIRPRWSQSLSNKIDLVFQPT